MTGPAVDVAGLELTAVTVLTALARAGFPDREGHRHAPDFGDVLCRVVTTVAANVGGGEALLAGRSGSWEADLVRQIVVGTSGDAVRTLLELRTEPLRLPVNVDDVFGDVGLAEILFADEAAAWQSVGDQAEGESDEAYEAREAAAARTVDAINALYDADQERYRADFLRFARGVVVLWGGRWELDIVLVDPSDVWAEPFDELVERVREAARVQTPLPATGAPPDWSTRNPADAIRAAGRTYLARVGEQS